MIASFLVIVLGFCICVSVTSDDGFSFKKLFAKEESNDKDKSKDDLHKLINDTVNKSDEVDFSTEASMTGLSLRPEDVDIVADELNKKAKRITDSATEEEIRQYEKVGICLTDSYLNVRESASTDADVVGIMEDGSFASILGHDDGWYKIKSGDVEGYVVEDNIQIGEDVLFLLQEYVKSYAIISDDKVSVYEKEDDESDEVAKVSKDEKYEILKKEDDWYYIKIGGNTKGYVQSSDAEVDTDFALAISASDRQKMLEAEKNAKSKAESKGGYNGSAMKLDAQTYAEFVALVFCESGGQPLKGKIAVAQVVLNRVASGKYPNSVHAVIYQAHQFGPVNTGKINGKIQLYKSGGFTSANHKECITAVNTALDGNGKSDIGDRLHFNGYEVEKDKGHPNPVQIADHLFW